MTSLRPPRNVVPTTSHQSTVQQEHGMSQVCNALDLADAPHASHTNNILSLPHLHLSQPTTTSQITPRPSQELNYQNEPLNPTRCPQRHNRRLRKTLHALSHGSGRDQDAAGPVLLYGL